MKKLLLLITGLLLLFSVEGQILRYSNYTSPTPPEPEEPTNLISNGTFDSSDDWTLGGDATIGTGILTIGYDQGYAAQSQSDLTVNFENSTDYTVTFDCHIVSGTPTYMRLQNSIGTISYIGSYLTFTEGENTFQFTTSEDITTIESGFRIYSAGDATITIDNLVIIKD